MSNPQLSIVDEEWMQIAYLNNNNERFFDYVKIPEIESFWAAELSDTTYPEVNICTKGGTELSYNVEDANKFTSAIRKIIFHYKCSIKNNQI